jgi:hypothetical protein
MIMAKSDSFFIRADIESGTGAFAQTSIDLGAYVDALGKSVLRIHNIAVAYTNQTDLTSAVTPDPNKQGFVSFQISTQSQTAMIRPSDRSVVCSGSLTAARGAGEGDITLLTHDMDVAPQHWTNGYLIGVEALYLAAENNDNWVTDPNVSVIMECTVETLSQSAAMALALSQQ